MLTIQDAFLMGIKTLKILDIQNHQLDAKILLKYLLNLDNETFELKKNDEISKINLDAYLVLINRRSNDEPIAHIVEKKSFWNDDFKVSKDTLIPRPETELIIESVIKYFPNKDSNLKIADLGTGSGCIIISLLQEYINAYGVGIDISKPAIDVANINKRLLKNPVRLDLVKGDFDSFNLNGFDIIVSNPPYISKTDQNLQKNVHDYEPHLALFSENNGLIFYEKILKNISSTIKNKFYLFLEIGKGQEKDILNLLKKKNFTLISIENDLAEIPRCIVAKKS